MIIKMNGMDSGMWTQQSWSDGKIIQQYIQNWDGVHKPKQGCMLLPCHVRISEWIHTLYLPERQGTPCSKQARYLKLKWLQRDSNPQLISL